VSKIKKIAKCPNGAVAIDRYGYYECPNSDHVSETNDYVIRDWMTSETIEFNSQKEAIKHFEKILLDKIDAECDIQLYHVIRTYNNVD